MKSKVSHSYNYSGSYCDNDMQGKQRQRPKKNAHELVLYIEPCIDATYSSSKEVKGSQCVRHKDHKRF